MPAPDYMELGDGTRIPILYEDRSVLAVDKPAGWMLVPYSWQRTDRNLQAAIVSSIAARQFWARSRNLKFLRYVHRLDAETTGVMLFAKSPRAVDSYAQLFESRRMQKRYLLVVEGVPEESEWTCQLKLAPDPKQIGRMRVDAREGKEAETQFRIVRSLGRTTLLEARPWTGRTHQIRVHAASAGHAVVGDPLYGTAGAAAADRPAARSAARPMALRAVSLSFADPFTGRPVAIVAPVEEFLRKHGFEPGDGISTRVNLASSTAASDGRAAGRLKPPGGGGQGRRRRVR